MLENPSINDFFWLVVTGTWLLYDFPFSWEESSQLTFIFFGGVETTNQYMYCFLIITMVTIIIVCNYTYTQCNPRYLALGNGKPVNSIVFVFLNIHP